MLMRNKNNILYKKLSRQVFFFIFYNINVFLLSKNMVYTISFLILTTRQRCPQDKSEYNVYFFNQ